MADPSRVKAENADSKICPKCGYKLVPIGDFEKCTYCGYSAFIKKVRSEKPTFIDSIVSRAKGGTTKMRNCPECGYHLISIGDLEKCTYCGYSIKEGIVKSHGKAVNTWKTTDTSKLTEVLRVERSINTILPDKAADIPRKIWVDHFLGNVTESQYNSAKEELKEINSRQYSFSLDETELVEEIKKLENRWQKFRSRSSSSDLQISLATLVLDFGYAPRYAHRLYEAARFFDFDFARAPLNIIPPADSEKTLLEEQPAVTSSGTVDQEPSYPRFGIMQSTRTFTCYYCGAIIVEGSMSCPECSKPVLTCEICKRPINFDDEVGTCIYCNSRYHYSHIMEQVKVNHKCPVGQCGLNEDEVLKLTRQGKN
ncbi:MAG: hypothetical protein ACFFD4_04240 [Candidatus Odinarchaeota archaeon]